MTYDPDTWVPALLESLKKVSFPDVKMVMRDMYLHNAGLFPALDRAITAQRPLASVALHESENTFTTSRLQAVIDTFVLKDISKHTNLSLMEYLHLPHDYVIMINNAVELKSRQQSSAGAALTNELESIAAGKP